MVKRRIRVVHLIGGLDPGGTERQLGLFLDHLNRDSFEFTVLVLNADQNHEAGEIEKLGIRVLFVPSACRSRWRRLLFLTRALRQLRADVVHSWSFYTNLYAGWAGRLAGVPRRLGSLRGSLDAPNIGSLSPVLRWLSQVRVEALVVNSKMVEAQVRKAFGSRQRIFYVPNLLRSDLLDAEPLDDDQLARLGLQGQRLIGAVGHLRAVKDHPTFIAALSEILPEFPDVSAVILGREVPEEIEVARALHEQIAQAGLEDRVVLAGHRADVPRWLRCFEIFCQPSRREATPNAVLEAMALGLPIVATRVGELPWLLDKAEGDGQVSTSSCLVPTNDAKALAMALRRRLQNPAMARQQGQANARRLAECFDTDRSVRLLEALYKGTWNELTRDEDRK